MESADFEALVVREDLSEIVYNIVIVWTVLRCVLDIKRPSVSKKSSWESV